MFKMIRREGEGILVEYNGAKNKVWTVEPEVSSFLQPIVQTFPDVFQNTLSLPPQRTHDHQINLKEEKKPINIWRRYPLVQKNDIEQMIQDMLKAGIIQPSRLSTLFYSQPQPDNFGKEE